MDLDKEHLVLDEWLVLDRSEWRSLFVAHALQGTKQERNAIQILMILHDVTHIHTHIICHVHLSLYTYGKC